MLLSQLRFFDPRLTVAWLKTARRKLKKLATMLPDVIGTWKFEGNRGDPGGSGPDGVELETHEMQPPVTDPVSPTSPTVGKTEPVYLEVTETAITPVATSTTAPRPGRNSILFDPSTMERRNNGGQVCVFEEHHHHHHLHYHS